MSQSRLLKNVPLDNWMYLRHNIEGKIYLYVMFAAENNFFNDSIFRKVDEAERLFGACRFVDAFDGSNDFPECRKILKKTERKTLLK